VYKLYSTSNNPTSVASAQLTVGAFFFAMRSCECSKTTSPKDSKRTKILTLADIQFFNDFILLTHNNTKIYKADIVSITFVSSQNNGEKNQMISMHKSKDPILYPIKVWASIVKQIRSYKGSSDSSKLAQLYPVVVNCRILPQTKLEQKFKQRQHLLENHHWI
jgi:hypothetical protein